MSCYNKQFSAIQLRRGLNSEFESSNIVLASGEPAYAVDERLFKIGDGATAWIDLPGLIASGSLLQFAPVSSSGLASLITDETGSGLAVFNTSPDFSGIPTAPTAVSGTNTNQIATTAFVRTEVSNLVDSAPEVLDTLNELAAAINDDASFYVTINNDISSVSGSIPFVINSGDNRLITSDGTNRGINAEANLTFDGSLLNVNGNLIANTGTLDILQFNTNNGAVSTQGQMGWNDTEGTVDIALTNSVVAHIAEHQFFRVRNETGDVLYKGQLVYADTVHPNGLIEPQLFVADGSIREIRFLGVVLENINNNNNGYVVNFGHIENMDLDGSASNFAVGDETWVAGDILYAHPTVPGKLTNVSPKHDIWVAIILDVGNGNGNGRMFVRPTSYGHLADIHDVEVSGVSDGQFLVYNSADDYWIPSSGVSWNDSNISLTDNKGIVWPSVGDQAYIIADSNNNGSISMGNVETVYINSTLDCLEVNTANGFKIQGSSLTAGTYSPTRNWTLPDADGTVVLRDNTTLNDAYIDQFGILNTNGPAGIAGLQTQTYDLFYIDAYGISFNTSNNFNFVTFNNTNLTTSHTYYLPDNDGAVVVENGPYITNPGTSLLTTTTLRLDSGIGGTFTTLEAYPTTNRTITFPDADGTVVLLQAAAYNVILDGGYLTGSKQFYLPDTGSKLLAHTNSTAEVVFDSSSLSGSYTYTLPDADGTVVVLSSVPTTSTDPGMPGQIATDGTDLYICVATDTWMKTTLSTF